MVRMLTLIALCAAVGICRESSAQILRGRQRSFVQAPQQPPPTTPTPPTQPVPPRVPPGGPPGAPPSTPRQPTPPTPGNPPHNPDKPWYECDECTPTTECKGEGPCEKENPPKIIKSDGPGCETTTCVPVDNKPQGELPSVEGSHTHFYKTCVPFQGNVKVPHYILNKKDTLIFAKRSYSTPCCTYQVCVVECCCTTTTKECDLRERRVSLEFCLRHTGEIDVYVLDVPGMPKRWALYLGLTLPAVQGQFPDFRGF